MSTEPAARAGRRGKQRKRRSTRPKPERNFEPLSCSDATFVGLRRSACLGSSFPFSGRPERGTRRTGAPSGRPLNGTNAVTDQTFNSMFSSRPPRSCLPTADRSSPLHLYGAGHTARSAAIELSDPLAAADTGRPPFSSVWLTSATCASIAARPSSASPYRRTPSPPRPSAARSHRFHPRPMFQIITPAQPRLLRVFTFELRSISDRIVHHHAPAAVAQQVRGLGMLCPISPGIGRCRSGRAPAGTKDHRTHPCSPFFVNGSPILSARNRYAQKFSPNTIFAGGT